MLKTRAQHRIFVLLLSTIAGYSIHAGKIADIPSLLLAAGSSYIKRMDAHKQIPAAYYDQLPSEDEQVEWDEAAMLNRHLQRCNEVYNGPFQKFMRAYALPQNSIIKKLATFTWGEGLKLYEEVDNRTAEAQSQRYPQYPVVYEKTQPDINRIINAERARACIEQHNFDRLGVPRKYVATHYKWGDRFVKVYAQEVQFAEQDAQTFTLEEVQQLVAFSEKTHFCDWGFSDSFFNWKRNKDGKIICIDTENASFKYGYGPLGLRSLLNQPMTEQAHAWLEERIAYWDEHQDELRDIKNKRLSQNTYYDRSDIDFETVKKQYKRALSKE
jgi:hypothetical protein